VVWSRVSLRGIEEETMFRGDHDRDGSAPAVGSGRIFLDSDFVRYSYKSAEATYMKLGDA
jgi:hypothetical protein